MLAALIILAVLTFVGVIAILAVLGTKWDLNEDLGSTKKLLIVILSLLVVEILGIGFYVG